MIKKHVMNAYLRKKFRDSLTTKNIARPSWRHANANFQSCKKHLKIGAVLSKIFMSSWPTSCNWHGIWAGALVIRNFCFDRFSAASFANFVVVN